MACLGGVNVVFKGRAWLSCKLLILNISNGLQIRLDQFDSGSRLQICGISPADESLQGFLLCAPGISIRCKS